MAGCAIAHTKTQNTSTPAISLIALFIPAPLSLSGANRSPSGPWANLVSSCRPVKGRNLWLSCVHQHHRLFFPATRELACERVEGQMSPVPETLEAKALEKGRAQNAALPPTDALNILRLNRYEMVRLVNGLVSVSRVNVMN